MQRVSSLELLVERRTLALTKRIQELEQKAIESDLLLIRQAEINEAKTRFVSIASHEFRTPLTSIQLSASLIEHYYDRLDKQKILTHLQKIKIAVSDLTAVLNDFLSVEKIESGNVDPVWKEFDLQALAEELVVEMSILAKPGQVIWYTHSGDHARLNSDKTLLRRCLVNLLSNAIKYSGEDEVILLHTEIKNDGCAIRVVDNGIGIPDDDQQSLFKPFFRAKNAYDIQGTGLGLNIVKRYAGLLKGEITFESALASGTTFNMFFPITT